MAVTINDVETLLDEYRDKLKQLVRAFVTAPSQSVPVPTPMVEGTKQAPPKSDAEELRDKWNDPET